MDDLTPMEPAEILEVPQTQRIPPEQVGYYSTCPVRKKRRYVRFVSILCAVFTLTASVVGFLSYYEIRVERIDGGYSMYLLRRNAGRRPMQQQNVPQVDRIEISASEEDNAYTLGEIYQKLMPSVVAVSTEGNVVGTGVVYAADGYIITAYHIIKDADFVQVTTSQEQTYAAAVIAGDVYYDLAILKIDAVGLTMAEFGDSDAVQVGDSVAAIGNPIGLQLCGTLTNGIISAVNRQMELNGMTITMLQTNAALNNGNSGGPLIDAYGHVIGINTAKIDSEELVEGIGFAIPSNTVKHVVDELLEKGVVVGSATMGITVTNMNELQRVYLNLPQGVYVVQMSEVSNAYAAGLRVGDIIVAIDNAGISNVNDYNSRMANLSGGTTVEVVVYRGGTLMTFYVLMEEKSV